MLNDNASRKGEEGCAARSVEFGNSRLSAAGGAEAFGRRGILLVAEGLDSADDSLRLWASAELGSIERQIEINKAELVAQKTLIGRSRRTTSSSLWAEVVLKNCIELRIAITFDPS